MLFDLEPGVIDTLRALFCPGNLVNHNVSAGSNWAKAHNTIA
jgi:hypothetical protein